MSRKIIHFSSLEECKSEKKKMVKKNFRALHTDFVDNGNKIRVTFVNGKDDPHNSKESLDNRKKFQRKKELVDKIKDNSLTFEELKEYMRLSEI